jgi:hypothetical protein
MFDRLPLGDCLDYTCAAEMVRGGHHEFELDEPRGTMGSRRRKQI